MLDVALRGLSFRYRGGFALREVNALFPKGSHTSLVGPPGCGATTLLRLIAGELHPEQGDVVIGARPVTELKPARRPLLFVTAEHGLPGRWSVQHALVAAVRARSLDREDRLREYELALVKWELTTLVERRLDALSATEGLRVHLARIELLRPGIVLADRLLERASPAARESLADELHRTLRVLGTTVISAPSARSELAYTDRVVVLGDGRVLQSGGAAEVFAAPIDDAAAIGTGEINAVPVTIRGNTVESVIGNWEVSAPSFQGNGIALARPADFHIAERGEESDLIFGIEEAGFSEGRWIARGLLSGGFLLKVQLPREAAVSKGKLLPLRYDPSRFRLLPRETPERHTSVPTDVVPLLRDSR
ncbi:MAG TPA: ATP-binding cassette domain-containing protein [Thermoanaerobaculia bacterium]|jgi:ABC-type Fe3+/spermidine/putrescine transport system ATPase subunit